MKKIFLVILMLFSFCLVGCDKYEKKELNETSIFIVLEKNELSYIVYNKETKVMYAISRGVYNTGTFTLLVNADGTPMLYEE